ncbi:unnamed protein product [Rotaria socialis]
MGELPVGRVSQNPIVQIQIDLKTTLNITMHYGDQADEDFLKNVTRKLKVLDVIVDDGGHSMKQQITSFKTLLPIIRSGGHYFIEDLLTSYMKDFGGKYLDSSTTIEFIKRLVDDMQAISPTKSTNIGDILFSFEISDEICVFNVK